MVYVNTCISLYFPVGCQNLRVIDSCWKLCIPHCMLAVQTEVDGFPLLNFPNICSDEPKPGSVFCESHHQLLETKSVPTEKGAFLKFLGCKGKLYCMVHTHTYTHTILKGTF